MTCDLDIKDKCITEVVDGCSICEYNTDSDNHKILKVCSLCNESFMGTKKDDTCSKCEYVPMYPSKEAADEHVFG